MLHFHEQGIWCYVYADGHKARHELAILESFLMLASTEPDHPLWEGDGYIHYLRRYDDTWNYFLRGFVDKLFPRLKKRNIDVDYHIESWSPRNFNTSGYEVLFGKLLNDVQRWAAQTMVTTKAGIFELPTRIGKSYISATAYVGWGRPQTAVLVPRADIVSQAVEEMTAFLGEDVGFICSDVGKPVLRNLTYISLASLMDAESRCVRPEFSDWVANVEAVIPDECHISGDLARLFHIATQHRKIQIALSATPFTDDAVKNQDLEGYFGPVRAKMRTKQAADLGLLAQMLVRMYNVTYEQQMIGAADGVSPNDYYVTMAVKNKAVNNQIAHIALSHISAGDKVIIFVDRVAHGHELHPLIPGSVANVGPQTRAAKDKFKKDFNEGELACVIVTKRWCEGITLKTDVIINAAGQKASHVQRQRFGRGLLPKEGGKPLVLYDFMHNDAPRLTFRKQSLARLKTYKQDGWPIEFCGDIFVHPSDVIPS